MLPPRRRGHGIVRWPAKRAPFPSRYPQTRVTYRNGKPQSSITTGPFGGWMVYREIEQPISREDFDWVTAKLTFRGVPLLFNR